MPSFSGKFLYQEPNGTTLQAGPCRVSFEAETFTLAPASGAPLAFDLGDIDALAPSDYELALTLYTGRKILLSQFGKTFQNLRHDLTEAYRARLVECLLLEDLEEVARFEGFARLESPARPFSSPAEFRLYQSNLAVLPTLATGFQWRLADIETTNFDEASYTVTLEAAVERLAVTKLAKRTREFNERLREALAQLTEKSAETLHDLFPFLTPDQFREVAQLMKEGRAAPIEKLMAIHPKTEQALVENAVDAGLKPYFEALRSRAPENSLYAGFKLIREEAESEATSDEMKDEPAEEPAESATEQGVAEEMTEAAVESAAVESTEETAEEEQNILYWFFFPISATPGAPPKLLAWEATSKSGRATYFFRLTPPGESASARGAAPVEAAVRQLNRAIVLLNFRREPIYLPDDSLEIQPRFHRYAIACRKIPELRRLRASFLGRAIHTSPDTWKKQLEGFLGKA